MAASIMAFDVLPCFNFVNAFEIRSASVVKS